MGVSLRRNAVTSPTVRDAEDRSDLEFWISNQIRQLRDEVHGIQHRLAVISNNDELELSDPNS